MSILWNSTRRACALCPFVVWNHGCMFSDLDDSFIIFIYRCCSDCAWIWKIGMDNFKEYRDALALNFLGMWYNSHCLLSFMIQVLRLKPFNCFMCFGVDWPVGGFVQRKEIIEKWGKQKQPAIQEKNTQIYALPGEKGAAHASVRQCYGQRMVAYGAGCSCYLWHLLQVSCRYLTSGWISE